MGFNSGFKGLNSLTMRSQPHKLHDVEWLDGCTW